MAGNTFHTAVDCLVQLQQPDTVELSRQALNYFNGFKTDPKFNPWVDDYGWWGIAFMEAYVNAVQLGYDASLQADLLTNAKYCWGALHNAWDDSQVEWVDSNGNAHSITGGIPNTTNDALRLAGRNCVTNECYWYLSSVLADIDRGYLDPKKNANNFFAQADTPTHNILFDSNGLVLERFFGMRSPDQQNSWPNTENPTWTWLGDQGLFAVCCYFNKQGLSTGNFNGTQAAAILSVVQAKKTKQVTLPDKAVLNHVLHEDLAPYQQFVTDYACGKGTFMRYLNLIRIKSGTSNYDQLIRDNAVALWANQLTGGLYPYYWGGESPEPPSTSWQYPQATVEAVLHAAGLSAMTAAVPLSSGASDLG